MADYVYNISKNQIDISDLRVLLVKSTYTPNVDDDYVSTIVAYECDFTNYARKALTGEAFTVDDTGDKGKLDADDPSAWTSAGGATNNTIGYMIVYVYNAADASAVLVSAHAVNLTTNGGNVTIAFSTNGILTTS